ncbi:MAG: EutN/CcmL family microcompartment protein [Kiritimatiellae bacterium]|jgi:microcompartment protein CcmK/EutM|nr:EutN/CcmL family microcompartment protein [Kiritimatiellia bacterium]NLD90050.1 EutN/CcmL family microcompartment protein [Lentisphaerota bacterium]HPC20265.1 EutN/CcmL family microcompartment protein [Kiritimatiellia bacterium]HQQ61715.1 EutN/CcmL family microcompartment protein [Kiritimatiellia bacterium]
MIIGKVIGNIHSTINHPFYDGKKMLVVERIEPDGKPASGYLVAIDRAGAGPGETVLVLDEGNGARQVLESKDGPVRSVIVGIVDSIETEKTP